MHLRNSSHGSADTKSVGCVYWPCLLYDYARWCCIHMGDYSGMRIRPIEAQEARETIRRFDPALALYLDVMFPVEECKHDWPKHKQRPLNMYERVYSKCGGCGQEGYYTSYRDRLNNWITIDEDRKRQERMQDFFAAERQREQIESNRVRTSTEAIKRAQRWP